MILEMSIGNRWPRPGQAAVGALDHVPVGDWPGLAARWLAAGFDSESLRQLAKLRSWETKAALAVMPEALRSTGFDPAPAEEEFTARCQAALDIVQRDLDVTGYGQYRVGVPHAVADSGIRGLAGRLSLDKGLRHDPRDGRRQPALQRGRIGLRHDQRGG